MSNLGAVAFFEKPIDFVQLKSRLTLELQTRPSERRAHVRVRMNLTLKLKGADASERSFEQLITTQNVSAGGFLCALPLVLSRDSSFHVFLTGAGHEKYVGRVQVARTEGLNTPLQRYAFQFTERTPEWIFQE